MYVFIGRGSSDIHHCFYVTFTYGSVEIEVKLCFPAFFFFGCAMQHGGILVPQPVIELVCSALGTWSLNHWKSPIR